MSALLAMPMSVATDSPRTRLGRVQAMSSDCPRPQTVHVRGPSTNNPKLVHYLAAGGVQGLRPLRYEKRVARNRFIFFVAALFLALLGILLVFWGGHR